MLIAFSSTPQARNPLATQEKRLTGLRACWDGQLLLAKERRDFDLCPQCGLRAQVSIERKEGSQMLFLPREEGQGLVEYALILVLVAIVVIVILALLGPAIGNIFSNIVSNI